MPVKHSKRSDKAPLKPSGGKWIRTAEDLRVIKRNMIAALEAIDQGEEAFQSWLDQMYPGSERTPLPDMFGPDGKFIEAPAAKAPAK